MGDPAAELLAQPTADIDLVQPVWGRSGRLRAGFSTRRGGVSLPYGGNALNLGWTAEDTSSAVIENRRRLVAAVSQGLGPGREMRLISARQVHSAGVGVIRGSEDAPETADGRPLLQADGLITDVPGLLLGVGTADCVPVLVADQERGAVGAFHAGWRGTVERIAEKGIAAMIEAYGSRPEDLVAAIGPSIGGCCYAVGGEVRSRFCEQFDYADELFRSPDFAQPIAALPLETATETFLDLWEVNRRQLLAAGLLPGRISVIGECTACTRDIQGRRRYFSHRAEKGVTGRMLSVIGMVDAGSGS